jgi:hypothetical protein
MAMSAHNDKYGWPHRRLRAKFARLVAAGAAVCTRCGYPIEPGTSWDLDHLDYGAPGDYAGPAHARCNRQAGRAKQNGSSGRAPDVTMLEW